MPYLAGAVPEQAAKRNVLPTSSRRDVGHGAACPFPGPRRGSSGTALSARVRFRAGRKPPHFAHLGAAVAAVPVRRVRRQETRGLVRLSLRLLAPAARRGRSNSRLAGADRPVGRKL